MIGLTKIAPGPENVGLAERPEPVAAPGQVVVRVLAAGICGTDLHIVADEFRSWPPVVLGHEVCGAVEQVGDGVDPAWLGVRVVSETYVSTCGTCTHCLTGRRNLCLERRSIGSAVDGAFAPHVAVPASGLHRVPEWLPSAAASLAEPLACVCQCLLDPSLVAPGDRVLVVGPGPVGLLAAQVARASGGNIHVRGIARDADRLAMAAALGFETSVDGDDLTGPFEVVVECSGHEGGMRACLDAVARGGRYVQIGLAGRDVTLAFDEVCYRELTVTGGNASTATSWLRAVELVERRAVELEPLVTEIVPLQEWERAFAAARSARGVKVVLDPRL